MARAAHSEEGVLQDVDIARRLFRTMALIRRFEERTEEQYTIVRKVLKLRYGRRFR